MLIYDIILDDFDVLFDFVVLSFVMDFSWILKASNLLLFTFNLGILLGSPTDFSVDSRAVAKYGRGVVTCTVTNPSGTRTETFITPQSDGTYKISYTPFEAGNIFVLMASVHNIYKTIRVFGALFYRSRLSRVVPILPKIYNINCIICIRTNGKQLCFNHFLLSKFI